MSNISAPRVTIIGGGPAGLMAAETLCLAGVQVDIYDAMPSMGRKFLRAGYGGPLSQDNNAVGLSFALDFTRSGSALPRFCL